MQVLRLDKNRHGGGITMLMIGDFNIDFCNHCTILHSFSFQQFVEDHTLIIPTGSTSCIDLVLVSYIPTPLYCKSVKSSHL